MVIMRPEGGEGAERCRKNTSADDKRWRRTFAVSNHIGTTLLTQEDTRCPSRREGLRVRPHS
jgi:hypothetical protein